MSNQTETQLFTTKHFCSGHIIKIWSVKPKGCSVKLQDCIDISHFGTRSDFLLTHLWKRSYLTYLQPLLFFLSWCFPSLPKLVHHRVQVKTALQPAKGRQQKRQHRNVSPPHPALLHSPGIAAWLGQIAGCAGFVCCCLTWSVLLSSQQCSGSSSSPSHQPASCV